MILTLVFATLGVGCNPLVNTPNTDQTYSPGVPQTTASSSPSLTQLSSPATSAMILFGKEAYDSDGNILTGTINNGGNITGSNSSLTFIIPLGYYDGSQTCSASDANLTAENIVSGVTIFGVIGKTVSLGSGLGSNAYRSLGVSQISVFDEANTYSSSTFPVGYRDVPNILIDDDGLSGGSVTYATRPSNICGYNQTSIADRISACKTANGSAATYNGSSNGNSGQSTWYLVTYSGTNSVTNKHAEVWQDAKTGLLWSSLVGVSQNWCEASGNAQGNDPSNYCNSISYQPNYPAARSFCAETSTSPPNGSATTIPALASEAVGGTVGGTWLGTYSIGKGGMGAQSSSNSPSVFWRLPTVYDYEQANIDGLRFVMPDSGTNSSGYEWSSSIYTSNRSTAWAFEGSYGTIYAFNRPTSFAVRCIGR